MRYLSSCIFTLLVSMLVVGCDSSAKNPTDSGIPPAGDTTGNPADTTGSGSLASRYGTLYFQNTISTKYIFEGPVRTTTQGVIIADNQTEGHVTGAVKLDTLVDFHDKANLTFIWQGGGTGGTTYKFFTSVDDSNWTETPYHDDGAGWIAAPFLFWANQTEPIKFKFVFELPAGGRVRIPQIRGYGKR